MEAGNQLEDTKMKAIKSILTGSGLIFFLFLLPAPASARVGFHIGFGAGSGHRCSGFHIGCHPYYRLHGDYYRWPGRCHKVFYYRHFPRYKPRCSPRVSVCLDGLFPILIKPPVVVKTPKVITERRVVIQEPEYCNELRHDKETDELFEKLRLRKSELLKKLRIGDKAKRKEAIGELAGFSFDDKVREALEDILLSDPDPGLRMQVAKSFAKTSNKKVLPALETAKSNDPNASVRQEAHNAIMKIKLHKL
jgi:hypothetical protein